jgi:hypothetical protein
MTPIVPIPKESTLEEYINQNGVPPGNEKFEQFQKALALRGTPGLHTTENENDPVASVKFFDPCSQWTWYAVEWDGQETCFGWVVGFEREAGLFSIKELSEIRGALEIGVEIDVHYKPKPLSAIQTEYEFPRFRRASKGQDLEPGD